MPHKTGTDCGYCSPPAFLPIWLSIKVCGPCAYSRKWCSLSTPASTPSSAPSPTSCVLSNLQHFRLISNHVCACLTGSKAWKAWRTPAELIQRKKERERVAFQAQSCPLLSPPPRNSCALQCIALSCHGLSNGNQSTTKGDAVDTQAEFHLELGARPPSALWPMRPLCVKPWAINSLSAPCCTARKNPLELFNIFLKYF